MNYDEQLLHDFLNTPSLLHKDALSWMSFFATQPIETKSIDVKNIARPLRLGHLTEQLFLAYLKTTDFTQIHSNIQIIEDKKTLGELDFICKDTYDRWHHIELAYKVYCFDPSLDADELKCCIGPNRKDILADKLEKFRVQQLPLIDHEATKKELALIDVNLLSLQQSICLKGQLYLPFESTPIPFKFLNEKAIAGYYINHEVLDQLINERDQFFVPPRREWLLNPHREVDWVDAESFRAQVYKMASQRQSPLCWRKAFNGNLERFFVVWW